MTDPRGDYLPPTLEEVADLLRSVDFTLGRSRTSLVANCRPQHVGFIERDVDRLTEMMAQVKAMLDRLPPEPPMTPEREQEVGGFIAAVLDKRFGDGSQEAVDVAAKAFIEGADFGRTEGSDG